MALRELRRLCELALGLHSIRFIFLYRLLHKPTDESPSMAGNIVTFYIDIRLQMSIILYYTISTVRAVFVHLLSVCLSTGQISLDPSYPVRRRNNNNNNNNISRLGQRIDSHQLYGGCMIVVCCMLYHLDLSGQMDRSLICTGMM